MAKTKADKPNVFVRFGRKVKEIFSELKKVTWPSFGKVVKTTCVVLVMVAIFMVAYTAVNTGLSAVLTWITNWK